MYSFESRVRYSEVDSEKQLTLPALLDYLQDCCIFQSEELGIGVEYLAKKQVAWVLSSWQIEILRYPELGDKIRVGTWPYHFKGFYGYRNFTVEDDKGEILARANSVWVFMDTGKMRPVKIYDELVEIYRNEFETELAGDWGGRKLLIPTDGEKKSPVQVARSHIDTNHHMNNGKYVQAAEEFLPAGFNVGGLRAEYKKAAVLGDVLLPVVTASEEQVTVVLADERDKPYAVVEFLRK